MNSTNDATLIEQFITGKAVLAANQNLRIEPLFGANRLLDTNGALVASIDLTSQPTVITIRQGCASWSLLHAALCDRNFMIMGKADQLGFLRYEAQNIPLGYKMSSTEARVLWKVWADTVRSFNQKDIRLDLLIFDRGTWYPIQEIACQRGIVLIKTLINSLQLQDGDYVTWIQRQPGENLHSQGS
ncbi:MAG: hypothetical protein HC780_06915 [Leptolyngbyaceae cyanobacterium CSU_1_3]|nr:hypothetical protein [Leptolyngbyaceae cyanobacterium CSU_1_3]